MRFLLLLTFILQYTDCARILGVFPFPSYSHFLLGETLFKELAARGHEVTVITAYPQKEKIKNYRDVPVPAVTKMMNEIKDSGAMMDFLHQPAILAIIQCFFMGTSMSDMSLQEKGVQDLIHSNETYDVIIMEQFLNEAYFGLKHHFDAPLILIGTTIASLWTNTLMGNPTPYATTPNLFLNFSPKMNFLERTWNTIISTLQDVIFRVFFIPQHDNIMHKYFPDAPPLRELMHSASLMLLNSNPAFGSPATLLPNMVEVGGFHIEGQKHKNLTNDLKKYLDDAKEGVIYFSMGSTLQSRHLHKKQRQEILNTFSKLNMKVLWKFEDDNLPGKPDNVRIEKWLPQPAVLAHKNVRLFITHGGKLSSIESIYYGKPILGIPMFAEQYSNIQEAMYLGYGLFISYQTLTEEKLTKAINEMIQNPKYAKEANYRSSALRDVQVTPLSKAIYWIEYIIKHNGAPHLKTVAVELSWYQHLLLDVILFLLISLWIVKKIIWTAFAMVFGKSKTQKQKTN